MLVTQHAININVVICSGVIYANITNSLENSGDRAPAPMDLRLLSVRA
jgi:hypothetical protein